MRHSLRLKLFFSFMLVITVVLAGVLTGVSVLVKGQTLAARQQQLLTKGTELAATLQDFYAEQGSFSGLDGFLSDAGSYLDARIWILDTSRRVIYISGTGMGPGWRMRNGHGPAGAHGGQNMQIPGNMRTILDELNPVFSEGKSWVKTRNNPFYGEQMLITAVPIMLPDGRIVGAVLLNSPVSGINAYIRHIHLYIGAAGLLAMIIAFGIVNRLTRDIVRPLKEMEQAAAAMARGDYSTAVKVETADEVGSLGTALNALARDLAKYVDELKRMENLRRDFVANVSHELRTPLTVIRGYTEALLDGTVDDAAQAHKYHGLMRDEAVRLERLIKDLLDLSRLQSGQPEPAGEPIPLPAIVDSVVNMMCQAVAQKQITLNANTNEQVPPVPGNGDRLTQLMLILLDNAVKYTPAGGTVTISVSWEEPAVVLRVADTGKGIPAEDLPLIWERFYKVDKAHCRDDNGTGLGLAIAKQIIDLHGAKAAVFSKPGEGTTFTVSFPAAVGRKP